MGFFISNPRKRMIGTKTIFCDIDGVLIHQPKDFSVVVTGEVNPTTTNGDIASILFDWHIRGYEVILITGRPENMREITEDSLRKLGLLYDRLIMGVGSGPRYLINDIDPEHEEVKKAIGINLKRNQGLSKDILE